MNKSKFLFPFHLCTFLTFIILSLNCSAQEEIPPPPQSMQKEAPIVKKQRPKFTVGGGMGFQFGTYSAIDVMPQAGVYATPWLLVLVNGEYSYMWSKNNYNSHVWGIGAAMQPCIIKRILIHVGYEFTQVNFKWVGKYSKQVQDFHFVVIGAGYKHYITNRIYLQALVLLNIPINQPKITNYSYNYYPYFRVGVGVDL
ncbi:MAG: hypothetical protein LBU83_03515 [Bacteroidales bacterium]|jgi:hypothetical protein|nr:hypothetical protein [Bacteroidales bacterium]